MGRMGRAEEGLTHVRAALDRALRHGLATPAAEVYQRLADSLEQCVAILFRYFPAASRPVA